MFGMSAIVSEPVLFPLTITVTEMSVNGNTSIQLTVTIIVTEIHAKTVT
jgi:hypothetical protein